MRQAVENGVVAEAKHSNTSEGVCFFILIVMIWKHTRELSIDKTC